MKYANRRAEGIALMREHARQQATKGKIREAHLDLTTAMHALIQEFRVEFNVPGVRYWYHPESECYFTTGPGDHLNFGAEDPLELARHEFLARQDLHFGYDDRL